MSGINELVGGTLLITNGRAALLLSTTEQSQTTTETVCLRYAFITQGVETPIFPTSLLDDWGHEIKGLSLYEWVRNYGDQFPRGEIFGFELDGRATQCFLREIELYERLRCYAYPSKQTPLAKGHLVEAVLLPEPSVTEPTKIKRPSLKRPLRGIQASWWHVPPTITSFDFPS